jgi:formate dehydrogenase major subunit
MDVTRRSFFKLTASAIGATSLATLGFSTEKALADVREFKLTRTTETRNTCCYCSVGCGIIMHALGDKARNAPSAIIHIEGDPDHPVNRGTLCPKGQASSISCTAPTDCVIPSTAVRAKPNGDASPGTGRSIGSCV